MATGPWPVREPTVLGDWDARPDAPRGLSLRAPGLLQLGLRDFVVVKPRTGASRLFGVRLRQLGLALRATPLG